ncbi:response regulator [Arcticibacter sp.]|uniref:response regulator n=1 Tax=Arcticibacter sp. TaxID=1872630 RepID=UPI00388E7C1D
MLSTKKEKDPSEGLILVVDDNEINRYVANKLLTQCGFEVELAEDGQVAVNKVAVRQYDIILMDIHMPVLDGFKATEIIRSYNEGEFNDLPIVALTCSVSERALEEIGRSGMTGYIPKPFVPEELKRKVKDILGLPYVSPEP